MDTLKLAVLIYFVLCLQMGLTASALNIVYKMRRTSSKGTRKLKREGGQREESSREEKTESQPVLKKSSGRGIHKRGIFSGAKSLKPGPAANKVPSAKNTAPIKGSEPSVALKDASVNTAAPPVAPQRQSARTEDPKQVQPKNTAPVESSEPSVA